MENERSSDSQRTMKLNNFLLLNYFAMRKLRAQKGTQWLMQRHNFKVALREMIYVNLICSAFILKVSFLI